MTAAPDIQALRAHLLTAMDARNRNLGRKPKQKKTRDLELEFMCGVAAALEFANHPNKQMPVSWAFLMSVGQDPMRDV